MSKLFQAGRYNHQVRIFVFAGEADLPLFQSQAFYFRSKSATSSPCGRHLAAILSEFLFNFGWNVYSTFSDGFSFCH